MSAEQDAIRELAYRLWQEGGCADGRDLDYWLMAEAQLGAAKLGRTARAKGATAKAAKPAAAPRTATPKAARAAPRAKAAAKA